LKTETAGSYLKDLGIPFEMPKNPSFVKLLITLFEVQDDFLILDFFAWSWTTGDAVMQLNAEDRANGKEWNRKYILVQIPEPIDSKKNKTAFDFVQKELGIAEPTIFEITKERLVRAGKKVARGHDPLSKQNNTTSNGAYSLPQTYNGLFDDKEDIKNTYPHDFGFKIFETQPIWEDYEFKAKEFEETQTLFDESKLTDEDLQMILTTWKTYDNIPLTESLENVDLDSYIWYYGNKKLYLMDKWFETKNLKAMINKIDEDNTFNPVSIIIFGYRFESKILREISENIKNYTNKKQIDIDVIVRY